MNEIVNKFKQEKFIPEIYLQKPGFTYSTCRTFTKNIERIQIFRETGSFIKII